MNLDRIQYKFRGFLTKVRYNLEEIELFLDVIQKNLDKNQKKFRRNLDEIQTKFRQNLGEIQKKLEQTLKKNQTNLDVSKKIFRLFKNKFRQNLDISQMNLDMDCPKKLDKIQSKFRQPI